MTNWTLLASILLFASACGVGVDPFRFEKQSTLVNENSPLTPGFLYSTNAGANSISTFSISSETGKLTQIGTDVNGGNGVSSLAIDPHGKFAYVPNFGSSISYFSINSQSGMPVTLGLIVGGSSNERSVIEPTGRFIYISNSGDNTISTYSINQTTGYLQPVFSNILLPWSSQYIAMDPLGRFVYSLSGGSGVISVLNINQASGELTYFGDVSTGRAVFGLSVSRDGRFAYTTDYVSNVSLFYVDPNNGNLTFSGLTFPTGIAPYFVTIDKSGRFLYTANFIGASISMFSINQTNGTLSSLGPDTPCGLYPRHIAIDRTGQYAYIAKNGGTISSFRIDPLAGFLSSLGADVPTGALPKSITTTP